MVESIFPVIPEIKPPVADSIAAGLLTAIDAECARRAGQHVDWWRAFWQSEEATPQEIAKSMGPSGALFFGIAAANVKHIAEVAAMVGKSPTEFMPEECRCAPQKVTINSDYTVTIG